MNKKEMDSFLVNWKERDKNNVLGTLSPYDFFDRIINLRLVSRNTETGKNDEYVIRSDYEMYKPNEWKQVYDGKLPDVKAIRKCTIKPSIKVQYKQVAEGTAISIDIFVNNFFTLDKDGENLVQFNAKTYPLIGVEVQMGYFGQFAMPYVKNGRNAPTLDEFNEMKAPEGGHVLKCNVEYVTTDKLPPDSTLHIHGYVGSSYTPPVNMMTLKKDMNFSDPAWVTEDAVNASQSYHSIPEWVFENVTRRYLRNGYDEPPKLEEGKIPKGQADSKGVRVFYSEGVANSYYLTGERINKTSSGEAVYSPFFAELAYGRNTLFTMNKLKNVVSADLRYKALDSGDFLMFTAKESEMSEEFTKKTWYVYDYKISVQQASNKDGKLSDPKLVGLVPIEWDIIETSSKNPNWENLNTLLTKRDFGKNILPAVYNINTDALATIVCPFNTFLPNFSKVYFKSRYAINGKVGYYADFTATEQEFTILWQDISFATVEDVNECNIIAVGEA